MTTIGSIEPEIYDATDQYVAVENVAGNQNGKFNLGNLISNNTTVGWKKNFWIEQYFGTNEKNQGFFYGTESYGDSNLISSVIPESSIDGVNIGGALLKCSSYNVSGVFYATGGSANYTPDWTLTGSDKLGVIAKKMQAVFKYVGGVENTNTYMGIMDGNSSEANGVFLKIISGVASLVVTNGGDNAESSSYTLINNIAYLFELSIDDTGDVANLVIKNTLTQETLFTASLNAESPKYELTPRFVTQKTGGVARDVGILYYLGIGNIQL